MTCAPGIALEHALAQGVVDVADGSCVGSVRVFAGLGDAAVRAVVQVVVSLLDQGARSVVAEGHVAGLRRAARALQRLGIALQAVGARSGLVGALQRGGARCQGIAVVHLGAVAVGVPGVAGGAELDGVGQAPARGEYLGCCMHELRPFVTTVMPIYRQFISNNPLYFIKVSFI